MLTQDLHDALDDETDLDQKGNHQTESDDSEDPKVNRYKQLMQGSKQEAERALEEASRREAEAITAYTQLVYVDNEKFLELYDRDPKLAEKVAQNFEGFSSAKDLITYLRGGSVEKKQTTSIDKDEIIRDLRSQLEREAAMEQAEKQFQNLTAEQEELAKAQFETITKGLTGLTKGQIIQFAEMAATYARAKLSSSDRDRALLQVASTPVSNRGAASQQTKKGPYSPETEDLAASFGFNFKSNKK